MTEPVLSISSIPFVARETANAILATFLLTELILSKRRLVELRIPLAALLLVNLPVISHHVLSWIGSFTSAIGHHPEYIVRLPLALLGYAGLLFLDLRRLRPRSYGLLEFAAELKKAMLMVLPVCPFVVITSSFVFLVLTAILQKIGLPPAVGQAFVMYGQFYSPFAIVYWILKKDWLIADRNAPVLPTTKRNAS